MRTIAHISDVHFGTVDPKIADALVAEINERSPSLIVVSGDLTQRARAGQFKEAAEFLARLVLPKLVVAGNHDVPLYNVVRRFASPLGRYKNFITRDLSPVFADEEIHVVGLNTARPFCPRLRGFWKDGAISQSQLDETARLFESGKASAFRIVVTHHPLLTPPNRTDLEGDRVHGADRAKAAFERMNVRLLLAGHLHLSYRGDLRSDHATSMRSITSIHAGTAISCRTREEVNSYNWITIENDSLNLEVRKWNGSGFED